MCINGRNEKIMILIKIVYLSYMQNIMIKKIYDVILTNQSNGERRLENCLEFLSVKQKILSHN